MSNLNAKPFDREAHLEYIVKWWEFYYEGEVFPEYCIPKHGVCVLHEGRPVGTIFLYVNDSKLAHLAFPVIDPEVQVREKREILDELVQKGKEYAVELLGQPAVIFGITHNKSVGNSMKKVGFVDNGPMKTFACSVGGGYVEFLQ